ncbi:hypothetical protein NDU88_000575 [Pleurodeles waltl]|uniref:Uncharacterized protein n=1 Tax=Pleurodeles waltl TaxID=8319 RepID=A0AAV7MIG7_PLEWA|nr:hypothetical protein NDU88_000575 [Pleurodeles waltl]
MCKDGCKASVASTEQYAEENFNEDRALMVNLKQQKMGEKLDQKESVPDWTYPGGTAQSAGVEVKALRHAGSAAQGVGPQQPVRRLEAATGRRWEGKEDGARGEEVGERGEEVRERGEEVGERVEEVWEMNEEDED